jgi:hypothetical protein
VLREADEPDWNDANKIYSPEVQREMARIERERRDRDGFSGLVVVGSGDAEGLDRSGLE